MYYHKAIHEPSGQTTILVRCHTCDQQHELLVNTSHYKAWKDGDALIQNALPELNADQRELLISGMCGKCFDRMCKEEEY